jgi:hypothetical protein
MYMICACVPLNSSDIVCISYTILAHFTYRTAQKRLVLRRAIPHVRNLVKIRAVEHRSRPCDTVRHPTELSTAQESYPHSIQVM